MKLGVKKIKLINNLIDAKNNLLLLTAKNIVIKNQTSTNKSTYSFANGSSGYINAKAVNNEITSNINNLNNNLNNDNIDPNLNPDLSSSFISSFSSSLSSSLSSNTNLISNLNPNLNNLNSNTNSGINSNLSLNATNSIIVQYQSETMENLISSTNDNFNNNLNDLGIIASNLLNPVSLNNNNLDSLNPIITSQNSINPNNNHQELQYLKILYNLSQTNPQNNPQTNSQNNPQTNSQNNPQNNPQTNPQTNLQNNFNKIILNPIDDINQQWDQTTRGLTSASQVAVAITAVAIASLFSLKGRVIVSELCDYFRKL